MADPFRDFFEFYRTVVVVRVTEEGMYWEDEVPDEYAASYIEVEYPIRLVMADEGGSLHYMRFAAPQATNKDKQLGCVIKYNNETLSTVEGEATTEVTATRIYSTEFNASNVGAARYIHNINVEDSQAA
jgi:hypothetical protein